MATKSKKFKHTLFAKGLCLILAVAMFFIAALSALTFVQAMTIYGPEDYIDGNYGTFYSSYAFADQFSSDAYKIAEIADSNTSDIDSAISAQTDAVVTEAVNAYLDKKAGIIKAELEYAVNNYDESYFNYEYSAELITIPDGAEADTADPGAVEETTVVPKNIEAAQKILNSASGRDFLNYEALVRSEAFDMDFSSEAKIYYSQPDDAQGNTDNGAGAHDSTNYIYTITFMVSNLNYSETQIKSEFYSQYKGQQQSFINDLTFNASSYRYAIEELENLKYYAEDSQGNAFTNIEGQFNPSDINSYSVYAYFDGTNVYTKGIEDRYTTKEYLEKNLQLSSGKCVYVYMEDVVAGTDYYDVYSEICTAYHEYQNFSAIMLIAIFLISLLSAVLLLITYGCICGHSNEYDVPVTAMIDRIPTDIHFILSFGLIVAGVVFALVVFSDTMFNNSNPYVYFGVVRYGISALAAACWLVLCEWVASTARIKKAGYSFLKGMLIAKFISWNIKGFKKFKNSVVRLFSYKPQKMQKLTIAFIIGYILVNLLLIAASAFFSFFLYAELTCLICIALLITFNILVIIFLMKYVRMFDTIITATCKHVNIDFGNEKVPVELKLLADNLANSNAELEKAVAQAVKDEQMKTELITNVSHDLKTPLTSLITYSDLLSKCDITDENAIKYTDVIHKQSFKLKRLIEDLIEASKVSTGNVTLNMSILNLSELAVQAIVEYAPETEKNGNELVFNEPDNAPKVIADSAKTYRIISNLLSNAKKYSAPNTRIYVSVYTDGVNGYFEVKNISSEPLNISPDELTERFVRGDKSRSKEGNGLGLAIAKDLCLLQNGELKLIIDGDLFKAIVKLPCKQEEPKEVIGTEEPAEE
ncbi:MAG: HAMP domain-containing histidine kinase [Clostridia bacterium]|nr:HAMP domain-containing histidine kinase [Clostridia bacterium]